MNLAPRTSAVTTVTLVALTLAFLACGKSSETTSSSGGTTGGAKDNSKAWACIQAADSANSSLREAAGLLMRPPVDQSAWSSAESAASSAIGNAESACGGSEPSDQEVKGALSTMRTMLGELGNAARGSGGGGELARYQESIDAQLDKAKSLAK